MSAQPQHLHGPAPAPWLDFDLVNPWYDNPLYPAQYRRPAGGRYLEVRGAISGGEPGTVFAVLPVEHRPDHDLEPHTYLDSRGGRLLTLQLLQNGSVIIWAGWHVNPE